MIPKRQGFAGAAASIPTGTGDLPPIPDAPKDGAAPASPQVGQNIETVVVPANSANAILDALRKFTSVTAVTVVAPSTLQMLKTKNLVTVVGNHGVVSEKGLTYLVDFNMIA